MPRARDGTGSRRHRLCHRRAAPGFRRHHPDRRPALPGLFACRRARAKGKVGYVPEKDERHYLFREYIRVLDRLRPAAFVMENVKGMLSSTVESRLVFEMLMEDLASLGTGRGHHYEMRAIRVADGRASLQEAMQPSDFIVRAEEWGFRSDVTA